MGDQIDQLLLGHNPPVLSRNLARSRTKICRMAIESECSSFTIQLEKSVLICGYIRNRDITVPITICPGIPVILHSCFDELHLVIIQRDKQTHKTYYGKLCCCRNWEMRSLRAVEVGGDDIIHVPISIVNLRSKDAYHYNVGMQAYEFTMQCPVCHRIHTDTESLNAHMSQVHLQHTFDGERLTLRTDSQQLAQRRMSGGIEFCLEEMDEDALKTGRYVDFSVALETSPKCSEVPEVVKPPSVMAPAHESKPEMPEFANTERGLVAMKHQAIKHKEPMSLEYRPSSLLKSELQCRFVQKNEKWNFYTNKECVNFTNNYNKSISYGRRITSEIIDYGLKNYGFLMAREFNKIDYSQTIARHVNKSLPATEIVLHNVMCTWNCGYLETGSIKKTLQAVIAAHGYTGDVLELVDLLYTRGIVSSRDLVEFMS